MFASILAFLPSLLGAWNTWVTKRFDAQVQMYQARMGVTKDVAVAAIQGVVAETNAGSERLKTIAGVKVLLALVVLLALPVLAFEWKVVIWDTMLGWGTTPAIHGDVQVWLNNILWFLVGAPTVTAVASMGFNAIRDK